MATTTTTNAPVGVEKDFQTGAATDHHGHNGHNNANTNQRAYDYGGNPLAHIHTNAGANEGRLPAFGGEFQPGLYRPIEGRKFANPAPLGLSAFALTTFVLSCVNLQARGVTAPNIAVPLALGYGGLVQLLAGMW